MTDKSQITDLIRALKAAAENSDNPGVQMAKQLADAANCMIICTCIAYKKPERIEHMQGFVKMQMADWLMENIDSVNNADEWKVFLRDAMFKARDITEKIFAGGQDAGHA